MFSALAATGGWMLMARAQSASIADSLKAMADAEVRKAEIEAQSAREARAASAESRAPAAPTTIASSLPPEILEKLPPEVREALSGPMPTGVEAQSLGEEFAKALESVQARAKARSTPKPQPIVEPAWAVGPSADRAKVLAGLRAQVARAEQFRREEQAAIAQARASQPPSTAALDAWVAGLSTERPIVLRAPGWNGGYAPLARPRFDEAEAARQDAIRAYEQQMAGWGGIYGD
ncbi:MAG: hypothetical protein SFY95_00295 [Planctomycetota bacterium]|nr:hypothetical protein [Planctomycetota bacterium]